MIGTTTIQFETVVDDWNTPFSNEELEAIDAAFEAATQPPPSTTPSYYSSFKTPDDDDNTRPETRRRLPGSISGRNGDLEAAPQYSTTSSTFLLKSPTSHCIILDGGDDTRPVTRRRLPGSISGRNGELEAATNFSTTPSTSSLKNLGSNSTVDGDCDTWATARRRFPGSIAGLNGEFEATDVAFEVAAQSSTTPSLLKTPRSNSNANDDYGKDARPTTRLRLPGSISGQNGELGSSGSSGSFSLTPCSRSWNFRQDTVKMKYPPLNFGGRIVYSRTNEEVEEATLQILKMLEARRCETGRAVLGLDIEWKPSFHRGTLQGKAAVMQICGDMTHCYVLHIFHSGIPGCLQSLLENSAFTKVGVGIDNDAVKVFHDHNVSIKSLEDLSCLANRKLGGVSKQWSLSGLVEMFTCKQLLKPKKIRLGNWETNFLSKAQLRYAATDAFASWFLYEVLMSFPDLPEKQEES